MTPRRRAERALRRMGLACSYPEEAHFLATIQREIVGAIREATRGRKPAKLEDWNEVRRWPVAEAAGGIDS